MSAIIIVFASPAHAYYFVNGLIDFSYTYYETKTGNATTSSQSWSDRYALQFGSSVLDPRLLQITAGVSYWTNRLDQAPDQDNTTYNFGASFFPGSMISWSLYSAKNVQNIPSQNSLAGYDVETSTYGGTMNLSLSRARKRSNNNNYYGNQNNNNANYNNNTARGYTLALPDITLTAHHTESQSFASLNPLHETRDNQSAVVLYQVTPFIRLNFDGRREQYENLMTQYRYETTTMDLLADVRISPKTSFGLDTRMTERLFNTASGEESKHRGTAYDAHLDIQESRRLQYYYRVYYAEYQGTGYENAATSGTAQIRYYVLPELMITTKVDYTELDYVGAATVVSPETNNNVKSGALGVGAQYLKEYRPEALDPFIVRLGYDFESGFHDVVDQVNNQTGRGRFYQNSANLAVQSTGWRYESLQFDFNVFSKRDHSLLGNNTFAQTYRLSLSTSRIRDSRFNANASYSLSDTSGGVAPGPFLTPVSGSTYDTRTLQYGINFDRTLSSYLTLMVGANQSKTDSETNYSLATISPSTRPSVESQRLFVTLNGTYPISRVMRVRASASDEWQQTRPGGLATTSYVGTAGLDWQLRQIQVSADYRWRMDIPENSSRVEQEYLYLRASRPF